MRGGIDLGGTKIQAVVVDDDSKVLGEHREPTPTEGGPADVSAAMAGALREAAQAAGVETSELTGVGVGSPGAVDEDAGPSPARATCPAGRAPSRSARTLGGRDRRARAARQRRAGGDRRGVPARRRPRVRLGARRLLGHRRRRRPGARRQAVARARVGGRDRARRRAPRRRALPLRTPRLHGGLRGARRDGGPRARAARRRRAHDAVRDHGEARPRPADQRRLGPRAARARTRWR